MLILSMILRITGWSQGKLAEELGVSRASINSWLKNSDTMTLSSKQKLADKFNFPVSYFSFDLDQDIALYRVIFTTINENWLKMQESEDSSKSEIERINEILNEIEGVLETSSYDDYSDDEILSALKDGFNPFTGEVFDDEHILNNERVRNVLFFRNKRSNIVQKFCTNITYDELDYNQKKLYKKLSEWRYKTHLEKNYFAPYLVFSNRELINIICADVKEVNDLKNVSGIGEFKFENYAEDIFDILTSSDSDINDSPNWVFVDNDINNSFDGIGDKVLTDDDELPF